MDKFWKFMEEKGYGKMDGTTIILGDREADPGYWIYPMNQDLIGYMMEFVGKMSDNEWIDFGTHDINGKYKWLVSKINEIGATHDQ